MTPFPPFRDLPDTHKSMIKRLNTFHSSAAALIDHSLKELAHIIEKVVANKTKKTASQMDYPSSRTRHKRGTRTNMQKTLSSTSQIYNEKPFPINETHFNYMVLHSNIRSEDDKVFLTFSTFMSRSRVWTTHLRCGFLFCWRQLALQDKLEL